MSIAFLEPRTLPPRAKATLPTAPLPVDTRTGPADNPPLEPAARGAIDQALRWLRSGRLTEAQRSLLQLARRWPRDADVRAKLGLLYRQLGRLDLAIAELEEATRLAPTTASYHHQLALTYRKQGQFDLARGAYERALAIDPSNVGALIGLGLLHDRHLDESAKAAALYLRGAALLPAEAAMVHRWLAQVMHHGARVAPGAAEDVPASH